MDERKATGPYVLNDNGEKSDRKFWAGEMDEDREDRFDKEYMMAVFQGTEAKRELEKRKIQELIN